MRKYIFWNEKNNIHQIKKIYEKKNWNWILISKINFDIHSYYFEFLLLFPFSHLLTSFLIFLVYFSITLYISSAIIKCPIFNSYFGYNFFYRHKKKVDLVKNVDPSISKKKEYSYSSRYCGNFNFQMLKKENYFNKSYIKFKSIEENRIHFRFF